MTDAPKPDAFPKSFSLYRKRPVAVAAARFDGTTQGALDLAESINVSAPGTATATPVSELTEAQVAIATQQGLMVAVPGDYVVQVVEGEFHPCKPDAFAASYQHLDGSDVELPEPEEPLDSKTPILRPTHSFSTPESSNIRDVWHEEVTTERAIAHGLPPLGRLVVEFKGRLDGVPGKVWEYPGVPTAIATGLKLAHDGLDPEGMSVGEYFARVVKPAYGSQGRQLLDHDGSRDASAHRTRVTQVRAEVRHKLASGEAEPLRVATVAG